jgi:tubulin monoglycylase TTLL3/8
MIFDLKWTIKTSDIAFKALNKEQLVNHFARNGNLTTKVGLTRNLRNLKWFEDVDMDEFFPRSYDLADADELYDYIEDFKMSAAEIVLKLFLRDGAGMSDCQGREVGKDNYATSVQLALLVLNAHVRRCKVIDIDDDESSDLRLSHTEWTLLLGEPCPALARDRKDLPIINEASAESGGAVPAQFGTHWNQAALVKRQRTVGYSPHGSFPQGKGLCPSKCQLTQEEYDAAFVEVCRTRKFKDKSDAELRDKAQAMLDELKEMNTQSSLLGYDNVWIVKPAGKSRGRDIVCIRSINRLLEYIGYGVAGTEMHWVVQKYMERPYLINNRKFDFRQWVMVTDWNPLTVWFYDECYLRFSMSDFSLLNLEDNLTHLCNNSIQKDHANFEAVKDASMWDLASFREHLIANHDNGEELWTGKILPQMQNISKWALMCAQDMLENRKFSSEVYGYDFMLDQDLNIWLLEVNASPDMSASTHVTERLTARVMEDMIKVMVDAREFCWGRKKNDKTCEMPTGGWELVHRGEAEVSFPISAFGCKLALTGSEIQIPKVYVGSVPSYSKLGSKRETRADKLRDEQKKKEEERMKEEERKKEQRKAQIKAEIKAKKKEERRRQREAERQERQRVAAGGSDEGDEGETLGLDGEVLAGWGEDGAGMMMTGSGSAAAQSSEGVVNHAGCENRSVERKEGREGKTPLQQSRATNWALRASEKVREDVVKREKTNPRNASQRQPQPVNKQVLACTVVSFGDVFGS